MRAISIIGLLLLAFSLQAFARNHDWTKVQKLKHGTSLEIERWSGPAVVGKLESASGSGIRLKLWDGTPMEEISRNDVRRVLHLRRSHLGDPHKLLTTGAVIGGIAGATTVAITDRNDCQGCKGFRIAAAGAGGAMFGFLGAAIVGAGFGTFDLLHHSKVIYVAERPPAKVPRLVSPGFEVAR
ncbi:MAG TPA: hypothetical protein VN682_16760 [Terriglobales bacterium]|nr:hypothetical protein [Terriglobales bacterium]